MGLKGLVLVLSAQEDLNIDSEEDMRLYLLHEAEAGFTEIIFRDPATGREKILEHMTLLKWFGREPDN